jgi:hypothetical protein
MLCEELHQWANSLAAFRFPFDESKIPLNGIYLLFEKGEIAHGTNRIVRVGTHTGNNQPQARLKQHFLAENKDRSIFRKNIGRALLHRNSDPFLATWELDRTSRIAKASLVIDLDRQREIECAVSEYIRAKFSFCVVRIDDKEKRMQLESKIISTLSHCHECHPSEAWLGLSSPKQKIRDSGLWLVNELYKQSLLADDFEALRKMSDIAAL